MTFSHDPEKLFKIRKSIYSVRHNAIYVRDVVVVVVVAASWRLIQPSVVGCSLFTGDEIYSSGGLNTKLGEIVSHNLNQQQQHMNSWSR